MVSKSKTIVLNKLGENRLPKELILEGEWECALIECGLEAAWKTIPVDQSIKLMHFKDGKVSELINARALIPEGNYTIEELISDCNNSIEHYLNFFEGNFYLKGRPGEKLDRPLLRLDENTKKVVQYPGVINENELYFILFDSYLSETLGFPEKKLYDFVNKRLREVKTHNERVIQMTERFSMSKPRQGLKILYVTTDITENSIVDKKLINILRVLKTPKENNDDLYHYTFETPIYLSINRKRISSITLNLNHYYKDDMKNLDFEGDNYFIIHFRKIEKFQDVIESKDTRVVNKSKSSADQTEDDPFLLN